MMNEQTVQFVLNNGLAVGLLLALLWACWQIAKTIAKASRHVFDQMLVPLKEAAIKHLESVTVHLRDTSNAIKSLQVTLDKIEQKLDK